MKRCFVLLPVLALMLSSCTDFSAKPLETPKVTATPAFTESDKYYPSKEEQIALIQKNQSVWSLSDQTSAGEWGYLISDLDHNGRYEVISSTLKGTGPFSNTRFFEVNEAFDGLDACQYASNEEDALPDIVEDSVRCYYDVSDDRYYYVFSKLLRNDPSERYSARVTLSLKNGTISSETIASCLEHFEPDYVVYSNSIGEEISQSDYESSDEERFKGMIFGEEPLNWIKEQNTSINEKIVFAKELYSGYGFCHFRAEENAVWDFYPIDSDGIIWEVYLLDEEFPDAERFIPQAYSLALKNEGRLEVTEGQWVYIYCPCNSWTGEEAPTNCALRWTMDLCISETAERSDDTIGTGRDSDFSCNIVITKNPTGETVQAGEGTWFIAHADNAREMEWYAVDPNYGSARTLSSTMEEHPGLELEDIGDGTLAVRNIPLSFNGWSFICRFSNENESLTTEPAYIYVTEPAFTPRSELVQAGIIQ